MIQRGPIITGVDRWQICFEQHDPLLVDTQASTWGNRPCVVETYICDGPLHEGPAGIYYVNWVEGLQTPRVHKAADAGASQIAHLLYEKLRPRGLTGFTG